MLRGAGVEGVDEMGDLTGAQVGGLGLEEGGGGDERR